MFSTSLNRENTNPKSVDSSNGRSRRARGSIGTYNVKVLAGTALHTPRKYIAARRETISVDPSVNAEPSHDSDATIECDFEAMDTREDVSQLCRIFVYLSSQHSS
jgi:histone-lysine N-methyltransferase ASH1L